MLTSAEFVNAASVDDARDQLTRCCASQAWVGELLKQRPFADDDALHAAAARVFWSLDADDWREAFSGHPQIGDMATLRAKYRDTRDWSEKEQSSMDSASDSVLERLASGNAEYLKRFGYIFIVCATGKTANEMLALLEARIGNDAEEELRIAAAEQLKITDIRLEKLAR